MRNGRSIPAPFSPPPVRVGIYRICGLLPRRNDVLLHVARDDGVMTEFEIWHAAAFGRGAKLCGKSEEFRKWDFRGDDARLSTLAHCFDRATLCIDHASDIA